MEKILMTKASGEHRLDPDQQKKYLETFRERVVCEISLNKAEEPEIANELAHQLDQLKEHYQPLYLKISPSISESLQLTYLKIGQEAGLATTIVSADCQHSPFGLIVHTDHAVNLEQDKLEFRLPDKNKNKQDRPNFFQRLFKH